MKKETSEQIEKSEPLLKKDTVNIKIQNTRELKNPSPSMPIKQEEQKNEQSLKEKSSFSQQTVKIEKPIEIKESSFIKKNNTTIIFIIVMSIIIVLLIMKNMNNKGAEKKIYTYTTESNEESTVDFLNNHNGWGKAPSDINIEAVNIRIEKDTNPYNKYKGPLPLINLEIKNNGDKILNSFGVQYSAKDIANKINISSYASASGSIEAGWRSNTVRISFPSEDFLKLEGLDYLLELKVYVLTRDGREVILYQNILTPSELNNLPEV